MSLSIRPANPGDVEVIHDLIFELAIFEKSAKEFILSKETLLADGFDSNPAYICFVAELDNTIVGMSFCYTRYSTWKGKCLYLEDLIVSHSYRRQGIGTQLFQFTLDYASKHNFYRLQLQVLDWNESAINFYKKFNASFDNQWINSWVDF